MRLLWGSVLFGQHRQLSQLTVGGENANVQDISSCGKSVGFNLGWIQMFGLGCVLKTVS